MSPKELLYVEDALSRDTQMQALCRDSETQLFDPVLRNLMSETAARHNECFGDFYSLLQ